MKKTRLTVVVAAAALVISLLTGVAWAGGRHAHIPLGSEQAKGLVASVAAMHDSPAMESMHATMSPALQAQCDAMHEQMDNMMGSNHMAGGNGMGAPR
jgi:hypothetical protein